MKKFSLILFCLVLITEFNVGYTQGRSWYQKANVGGDARHRCTAFAIGNKGYYGGGHINSGTSIIYSDYWEYDPGTNSWTQIADFGGGLRYHSSAFVIGNTAYVGCGEATDNAYTNDFWKYVPEVNEWFPIADLPGIERRGGTAFVIDGKGYFGSGQSDAGYRTDFFCYDPVLDSWSEIANLPGAGQSASVGFTHNEKGYVGSGHITSFAINNFYEYDPNTDSWSEKASVGGSVRQDAMGFVIDGKGYLGTGNDNEGEDFNDIWEYDFDADTWTQIGDFGGAKRRYAVTFTIDNIPYLIGGTDGTNMKDLWAWAPSVSLEELITNDIQINAYPNPSTDIITIAVNLEQPFLNNLNYSIIDINGKTVQQATPLSDNILLQKSDFGSGIYFLVVSYNGTMYKSEKIIFN